MSRKLFQEYFRNIFVYSHPIFVVSFILGSIACTHRIRCGLLLLMSPVAWSECLCFFVSACLHVGHTGEMCKNG